MVINSICKFYDLIFYYIVVYYVDKSFCFTLRISALNTSLWAESMHSFPYTRSPALVHVLMDYGGHFQPSLDNICGIYVSPQTGYNYMFSQRCTSVLLIFTRE